MFFFVCLFWLQKRVWHFVASATIISFFVCLLWPQKRGWHFVASDTIMSFFVCLFSTAKEGMTLRCIRHYLFLLCMSFLTAKAGMTFRCIWHHHGWRFSAVDCQPSVRKKRRLMFGARIWDIGGCTTLSHNPPATLWTTEVVFLKKWFSGGSQLVWNTDLRHRWGRRYYIILLPISTTEFVFLKTWFSGVVVSWKMDTIPLPISTTEYLFLKKWFSCPAHGNLLAVCHSAQGTIVRFPAITTVAWVAPQSFHLWATSRGHQLEDWPCTPWRKETPSTKKCC